MSQTQPSDNYEGLPEHIREGVRRWLEEGLTPGSFLRAVIRNQLVDAVQRADHINLPLLGHIVYWFVNNAPEGSYGSDRCLSNWPMYLRAQARQKEEANG